MATRTYILRNGAAISGARYDQGRNDRQHQRNPDFECGALSELALDVLDDCKTTRAGATLRTDQAAYQRQVFYIDTTYTSQWANLTAQQPAPNCYSFSGPFWGGNQTWGIYFFFGGPGGRGC